ncbi:hypothetical protein JYU34_017180 [Plutella xylostella]|uniref:Uncharacterized protein n=1 Tax=Plutella xylostella TaxID=51655 RepID=A0ABQ7Q0S3_PLUXY|nr:hypothetical protein JYU34_017180 [Plutella xylostella]
MNSARYLLKKSLTMMADDDDNDDNRASNSAGGSAEHKISSQTGGVWIWQPEQECQVCAAMQVGQHSRQGRSAWLGLCSDAGSKNRWPGPGPGVRCDAGGKRRRPAQEHRAGCMLRCRWHKPVARAGAQGWVYAAMQVARDGGQRGSTGPGAGYTKLQFHLQRVGTGAITLLAAHATMSQHTETRSHVLPVKNPMTVLESSCL